MRETLRPIININIRSEFHSDKSSCFFLGSYRVDLYFQIESQTTFPVQEELYVANWLRKLRLYDTRVIVVEYWVPLTHTGHLIKELCRKTCTTDTNVKS